MTGKEIFSQILRDAEGRRVTSKLSSRSLSWFRRKVTRATKGERISTKSLMSQRDNLTSRILIGRMYHFKYDPKTKDKLPYYDIFPLVIPIEPYPDGFLGLNLHYLDPRSRARLMDKLFATINDRNLDERTKLRVSYQLLAGAAKYKLFKPTVKRYLSSHIRSRYLLIPAEEWQIALFLPTQRFQKANASKVWADSKKIARG